jgi:hypothetical protein
MRPFIAVQCMVTMLVFDSNDVETETYFYVSGPCYRLLTTHMLMLANLSYTDMVVHN